MDYQLHYDRLVTRAKHRVTTAFTEKHHVIPACMGGSNDESNLVKLTPEEHFVAHQLLVKLHPKNAKLAHAAFMMGATRQTNKLYGWIKRKLANELKGRPLSPETKFKLSVAQRKRDSSTRYQLPAPKVGSKLSQETRQKQSAAAKGKPKSEAAKMAMKAAWVERKKRPISDETRRKMSDAARNRKHSDETKLKMSQNSRWKQPRQDA